MSAGIDETLAVDRMTTGSIPAPTVTSGLDGDEQAVARAVADINLERRPNGPFAWANQRTGSTGVISSLEETDETGAICRQFTTTVHRYDGIALFDGKSCRDANGEWNLTAFQPVR